jgi:hypothetical protein
MRNATTADQDFARQNEFVNNVLRDSKIELDAQKSAFEASERAINLTIRQQVSAAKEQEELNGFIKRGVPITAQMREEVARLAQGYGLLAESQASAKLGRDIAFEREQLFRSDSERGLASRLRGTGIGLDSAVADQLRMNSAIEKGIGYAESFAGALVQGGLSGKKGIDIARDALKNLTSQLAQMATSSLIRSAFGSFIGGGNQPNGGGGSGIGGFLSGLFGFGGGGGGSGTNILGLLGFGAAHNGAIVPNFTMTRQVNPSVFNGAPRYHSGLRSNEFPAILEEGEAVLTKRQQRGVAALVGGQPYQSINIAGSSITVQGNADAATVQMLDEKLAAANRAQAAALRAVVNGEGKRQTSREWRAA